MGFGVVKPMFDGSESETDGAVYRCPQNVMVWHKSLGPVQRRGDALATGNRRGGGEEAFLRVIEVALEGAVQSLGSKARVLSRLMSLRRWIRNYCFSRGGVGHFPSTSARCDELSRPRN